MYGISEKAFWNQTPRQTYRQIEAAKLRQDRRSRIDAVCTAMLVNASVSVNSKSDAVDPQDIFDTLKISDQEAPDDSSRKSEEEHREEFEEMKEMMLDDKPDPQVGDDS